MIGATSGVSAFIKINLASEVTISQIPFVGGPRYAARLAVDVATQTVYYPDVDNDAIMSVTVSNDTASNRMVNQIFSAVITAFCVEQMLAFFGGGCCSELRSVIYCQHAAV